MKPRENCRRDPRRNRDGASRSHGTKRYFPTLILQLLSGRGRKRGRTAVTNEHEKHAGTNTSVRNRRCETAWSATIARATPAILSLRTATRGRSRKTETRAALV